MSIRAHHRARKGGALLLTSAIALPLVILLASWIQPATAVWQHLLATVLADYVWNSLALAVGVGLLSLLIGGSCAWCVANYDFPLRSVLRWLLLLPLAMPGYIIAYTYTGILDFSGPVQTAIRDWTGWRYGQYWFPDIQTLAGAVVMLALVLFPYVYLLALTAFQSQSPNLAYAAQSMGVSPLNHLRKIALPLAKPALLAGMALTMMEAFADYGTVQYFGIPTFTTGIYRVWFGMNSQAAAAQLSSALCLLVLLLLVLEEYARRKQRFYGAGITPATQRPLSPVSGGKGMAITCCLAIPCLVGFLIPVTQLLLWSWQTRQRMLNEDFVQLLLNSFGLAAVSALVIAATTLLLLYALRAERLQSQRKISSVLLQISSKLAGLGYAIPGTVIAIGVMLPFAWLDRHLNQLSAAWFGFEPGLLFSGTLAVLLFAYLVRFTTVAKHNLQAGLERIVPSMDEAATGMGLTATQILRRIHLPLLKGSVLSALLLVFVDVMKELPATLILRPFNFNTLAVKTFELASDERLADAALPAISIVAIGLLPVVVLARKIDTHRES